MINSTRVFAAKINTIQDPERFTAGYHTIPRERQQRIDRLMRTGDKYRSLAASLLLQTALRDIGITDMTFCYGENGKPYLQNHPDVFFNLSHSGDTVMCAVSCGEVGCDVQEITDMNLRTARRFSKEEYEAILTEGDPDNRRDLFFRVWTLKESFLKATGRGLSLPLSSFTVAVTDDGIDLVQDIVKDRFYFKEFRPCDNYRFAVCSKTPTIGDITWITL